MIVRPIKLTLSLTGSYTDSVYYLVIGGRFAPPYKYMVKYIALLVLMLSS